MGFNEFLSSIFGNKSTRDMKEIQPWVDKIKAAYPEVEKLDNDGLRAKTQELKQYIYDSATKERAKVEELKASIESLELEDREDVFAQIDKLEKELLAQNAEHKDWACTEELMKTTKDGKALYLHCLPADITGVSCETGEVDASVFDRYRIPLYKEASFKPYIIAAMIMLSKFENPQDTLKKLEVKAAPRIMK